MKEHPIIFSWPMVRALLEGRKTQTRRVLRPQPVMTGGLWRWKDTAWCEGRALVSDKAPVDYGPQPGDRLWVRETFALDVPGCEHQRGIAYRADHRDARGDGPANPMRWRPSIHMPRWASRILLEVTDRRIERLQEISEEDAQREGLIETDDDPFAWSARRQFQWLWDNINAKRGFGWFTNPWVRVIGFRRLQP